MRDSHYLAMLLGALLFGELLALLTGDWIPAVVLAVAAGTIALILIADAHTEQMRRQGGPQQ